MICLKFGNWLISNSFFPNSNLLHVNSGTTKIKIENKGRHLQTSMTISIESKSNDIEGKTNVLNIVNRPK